MLHNYFLIRTTSNNTIIIKGDVDEISSKLVKLLHVMVKYQYDLSGYNGISDDNARKLALEANEIYYTSRVDFLFEDNKEVADFFKIRQNRTGFSHEIVTVHTIK